MGSRSARGGKTTHRTVFDQRLEPHARIPECPFCSAKKEGGMCGRTKERKTTSKVQFSSPRPINPFSAQSAELTNCPCPTAQTRNSRHPPRACDVPKTCEPGSPVANQKTPVCPPCTNKEITPTGFRPSPACLERASSPSLSRGLRWRLPGLGIDFRTSVLFALRGCHVPGRVFPRQFGHE